MPVRPGASEVGPASTAPREAGKGHGSREKATLPCGFGARAPSPVHFCTPGCAREHECAIEPVIGGSIAPAPRGTSKGRGHLGGGPGRLWPLPRWPGLGRTARVRAPGLRCEKSVPWPDFSDCNVCRGKSAGIRDEDAENVTFTQGRRHVCHRSVQCVRSNPRIAGITANAPGSASRTCDVSPPEAHGACALLAKSLPSRASRRRHSLPGSPPRRPGQPSPAAPAQALAPDPRPGTPAPRFST